MTPLEELYHNCRYCHWFDRKTDRCLHDNTFSSADILSDGVLLMAEDGVISGAITEGFSDKDFSELKRNLELSGLSKKKQKAIYDAFVEELSDVINGWTESIDDAVVTAIRNNIDANGADYAPAPNQPDTFYCRYFE